MANHLFRLSIRVYSIVTENSSVLVWLILIFVPWHPNDRKSYIHTHTRILLAHTCNYHLSNTTTILWWRTMWPLYLINATLCACVVFFVSTVQRHTHTYTTDHNLSGCVTVFVCGVHVYGILSFNWQMNRFAISHRFEIAVRRHSVPPHSPLRPNVSFSLSSFDELSCAHFIRRFLHVRTLFFCFFHQEITVKTRNYSCANRSKFHRLILIKVSSILWFFLNFPFFSCS